MLLVGIVVITIAAGLVIVTAAAVAIKRAGECMRNENGGNQKKEKGQNGLNMCKWEREGICEKHSDTDVKESCLEGPCPEEEGMETWKQKMLKRFTERR